MQRNVGDLDRAARGLGALVLGIGAFIAPLPLPLRLFGLGGMAGYMLFTAVAGTCLGYRLMGRSTCPTRLAE